VSQLIHFGGGFTRPTNQLPKVDQLVEQVANQQTNPVV
jgi:hypothetical protein